MYELDWVIADDMIVRPDIVVVCDQVPARHLEHAPAIVVEILSPSTAQLDLTAKQELYQEQAVPYYLILDPDSRRCTVHRLNSLGKYDSTDVTETIDFQICATCNLSLDVRRLFAT